MNKFSVPFEIKQLDPASGRFAGRAAVYGNIDLGGDVIMPGAFARTLALKTEVPLLWQHKTDQPLGLVTLQDSSNGLLADGQLDLDIDAGQRALSALKKKYVGGLSIGYDAVDTRMRKDGVRELLDLTIWEVSIVTFPMNPLARVTTVKRNAEDDDDEEFAASMRRRTDDMRALLEKAAGERFIDRLRNTFSELLNAR